MHVGISTVLRERHDPDGAAAQLLQAAELGEENGLPQNRYRSRVALAALRQTLGDPGGALELLSEAERLYVGDYSPDVRPVAAVKARVLIAQGRLSEAADWVAERGLKADDELSYVHEFEHGTLARVLLAQGGRDPSSGTRAVAIELIERLIAAADDGGRNGSVVDLLVALALAHQANDDRATALGSLQRAIALAEPEGYVRVFADEGPSIVPLLKLGAKQSSVPDYVRRLIAVAGSGSRRTPIEQPLVESLSERELEVLRLLASDLDGPDIARELTVSLPTVRTHTRNVYAKLGVNSRRAAVSRAAELGLLTHRGDYRTSV
jgi:LuxR family maltose regulon positive regulatory protein